MSRFEGFAFRMPRAALLLFCLAAIPLLASPGLVAEKGGPPRDIPLRVTFGTYTVTHRITNDRPDEYVDQVENVFAILYPSGNQGFNTQADTRVAVMRSLCFSGVDSFPAAGCFNTNMVMGVFGNDLTAIQSMTTVGQTAQKLVRFGWTIGSTRYQLGHGTDINLDDEPDAAPAVVTCAAASGSGTSARCTSWTVTPQGPAALFQALVTVGKGGKTVIGPSEYVGHYAMPFEETLTLK
jgi:hypothetical protein